MRPDSLMMREPGFFCGHVREISQAELRMGKKSDLSESISEYFIAGDGYNGSRCARCPGFRFMSLAKSGGMQRRLMLNSEEYDTEVLDSRKHRINEGN